MSDGGVQGNSYVTLKINDTELPDAVSCIQRITVTNSILGVPCAQFEILDTSGIFSGALALVNGTKVELTRGVNQETAKTMVMRVWGSRSASNKGEDLKIVVCILDAVPYLTDVVGFTKQGSSLDVAKYVCEKYGMEFATNIDSVDDSMRWTSFGRSARQFMEDLECHMWAGESVYPQTFVTEEKKVQLVDLNKVLEEDPVAFFCYNYPDEADEGAITVSEMREKSLSGIMAANLSYGFQTRTTTNKGEAKVFAKVPLKSTGQINVNADARAQITGTTVRYESYAPMSEGPSANVHKNWFRAFDAWSRNFALFSEAARIRIRGSAQSIEPMKCVKLYCGDVMPSGPVLNQKISGKWVYVGYTEVITMRSYETALLLIRNFTGTEGNTSLVSGSAGENKSVKRASSIADEVRPPQNNENVKQSSTGAESFTSMVSSQVAAIEKLTSNFASQAADTIGLTSLADKYGSACDQLDALLSEFNMAKYIDQLCGMLSPLEKLSLNYVLANPGTVLKMLDSRISDIESLQSSFTSDINGLIANGDIPSTYADYPTINVPCAQNKLNDLTSAAEDKLGSKCMDSVTIDKIQAPSIELASLYQKYEEYMRNVMCAMGSESSASVEVS